MFGAFLGEHDVAIPAQTICSLFSGIGGLDESVWAAPGSKTVVYVERESYAVATLCKKMEDKIVEEAPIWDDITSFNGRDWRGKVSTIIGEFPVPTCPS
jgi:DNA (cytosine-5)-methyltransferase 1